MSDSFNSIAIYVELIVNFLGLALGLLLIFRARDNRLKLAWGIYNVFLMGILIYSNILLLNTYQTGDLVNDGSLLRIELVVVTFVIITMAAIFPILSLQPVWLDGDRRFWLAVPFVLSAIVVGCFYWFDGNPTPLYQTSDIIAQIHRPDVQMRVGVFLLSIATSFYFLAIPFFYRWVRGLRRASSGLYLYSVVIAIVVVLYFFKAIDSNSFIFYIYGYALVLVPIYVSVILLFNENPLSQPLVDPDLDIDKECSAAIMSPESHKIYQQMEQYMQSSKPFVDATYSISQLASALDVNQNIIVRTIRERGFSGYVEYVTFWRIEYFKELARQLPGLSIKDLMVGSGFTSRSSFYRRFAQKENMSPKEYIERKL